MVVNRANGARLELEAPYHPALPYRARQVGGAWLGQATGWVFPRGGTGAACTLSGYMGC
jgi:hypothetical protein